MMRTGTRNFGRRCRSRAPIFTVAALALWTSHAVAATDDNLKATQPTTQVSRLLEDAEKALNAGNVNLALIQLKNAVRIAPSNGEARALLGAALLRSGQVVAAERELREARNAYGPYDIVEPSLLNAMLMRSEFKELLLEFPDPPQSAPNKTTADILRARAIAFQSVGQPKEARAAMDRSLGLRRDAEGLMASARLAQRQADLMLARKQTDETLKLAPTNEQALLLAVLLTRQSGDSKKALEKADDFVRQAPDNAFARVLRIEELLDLKQDAKAKEEVDALLKKTPSSMYGRYYRGVLMARANNVKGAWEAMQTLQPEFVQSQAFIAMMATSIAVASGNGESGSAILATYLSHHPENRLARLQLAATRLSLNAAQAAVDVLVPVKASNDPAVHALLAQGYLRLQRFDEAIASLQIASAPANASEALKAQLALSQLQIGETGEANQGLRALLQRDPGNVAIAAPLIAGLVATSKWDEALGVADGLAKQLPKSPLPDFYRGQIFIAKGDVSAGTAAFTKSLAFDSKFVPALYYRANASLSRGNPEEAKKDLRVILAQSQGNRLAYTKLAEIALNNGQDQEALALWEGAIKATATDPTPRLALANYFVSHGKLKEAQTTLVALLQVSRNNAEGLTLQGQIQIQLGQTADAIKTFRTLVANNMSSPEAFVFLARALYAGKDQAGAEEAVKKSIELTPRSPQTRMEFINIEIAAGKGEVAIAAARAFAASNPGPDADLLLADTYFELKRTDEAESVLEKSLSTKPDARIALHLSQMAMTSGNFKKAGAILSDWIAKNPNDFVARREYAGMLMGSGDLTGARREYETLLKQHPDDPSVLNNMGWLIQKDDPNRAFSLLSLAEKIAPRSPEIADSLGWMKYQRQDSQGALPLLQRAHNLAADSPLISYHLARALDAAGKRGEAKILLQATMAKNPQFDGSDDAKQLLARW